MSSVIVMHESEYWRVRTAEVLSNVGIGTTQFVGMEELYTFEAQIMVFDLAIVGFSALDERQAGIIAFLRSKNVPVIALVTQADAQMIRILFRDHNVQDVVTTVVDEEELIGTVARILAK